MATREWTEGLSAWSAGRFGGLVDEKYVHRINGLLGVLAGVNDLYAGEHREVHLGRYEPGVPWLAASEADWVCMRHAMKDRRGRPLATVYQSLLSPGVLFDVNGRDFTWFNDRTCQILRFFLPVGRTVKQFLSSLTITEPLSQPWALGMAAAPGRRVVPMLFVFQHKPTRIYNCNSDLHRFEFSGRAGRVAVMPLLGPVLPDRDDVGDIFRRPGRELLAACRTWARALLAYPVACREEFRVDYDTRVVHVRNRFEYLDGRNDWGWEPTYLAPASPVLAIAEEKGCPLNFTPRLADTGLKTYLGPFKAAKGRQLQYTLPLSDYLDQAVAPVKIVNSPPADKLTARLKKYLARPNMTFGGDNTYDPKNIQDVLHDMRVLAWATWSLAPADRRKVANRLVGRLTALDKKNYRLWRECVTGRSFVAEKEIWKDSHGDVSYDYEWYNGMQLGGLWAGLYFLDEEAVGQAARKQWPIIEKLLSYFEITNDWATATFWTDVPGEFLHMDGWHFGWQGIVGAYRLAKRLGKQAEADRAAYLAAKSAVPRWVSWLMTDYVQQAMKAGLRNAGRGGPHDSQRPVDWGDQIIGGFREGHAFALSSTHATGNSLGYLVPEMYLMYRREQRIRDRVRRGQEVYLPRWRADWAARPKKFGHKYRTWPYESAWHFYGIDDYIFVRSMVLRQPMEKLLKITPHLSGPAMEAILVAGAPMAVVPTDAGFRGNVWDAKAKALTVTLDCPQPGLELEIVWPAKPKAVEGATVKSFDAKRGELHLLLPAGQTEVRLQY